MSLSVSKWKQLHMDLKICYVMLGAAALSLRTATLSLNTATRSYKRIRSIGSIQKYTFGRIPQYKSAKINRIHRKTCFGCWPPLEWTLKKLVKVIVSIWGLLRPRESHWHYKMGLTQIVNLEPGPYLFPRVWTFFNFF